jgi:uncharacterized OsmC-like protein
MDKNTHARDGQLRAIEVFSKRPESAQVVNQGIAEVRDGLTCIYEQDGHRLTIDMPRAIGGSEEGLAPGFYGRAAICGCLAIGIKMTAAREDIHIEAVQVGIEQNWDNRGVLAMDGARPVPSETRISIQVTSSEPEHLLEEMLDRALSRDPWFLAFRDAQPVRTKISVSQAVA